MTLPKNRTRWWAEAELGLLTLFVLGAYFVRLHALPIYGEEPRRGLIAREMWQSGDWIVPRTQGICLPSRPPVQNWMIAAASCVTGSFDLWAIRLPSLLCTLMTVLMIYGYARQFTDRAAALTTALAFATMFDVLTYGRLGETEAVFTFLVSASLLLWHWGWTQGWPRTLTWTAGYTFMALGLLTKGLQAPIYFIGPIGLYLLVAANGDRSSPIDAISESVVSRSRLMPRFMARCETLLSTLFSRSHLLGLSIGILIFSLWQGWFVWMLGWDEGLRIYFGDVAGRFEKPSTSKIVLHLITYPFEVLALAVSPWSVLLLPFASRRVRESLGELRDPALFAALSVGWCFISVWLPPGARTRYFMPLFPSIAVLIGLSAQVALDRIAIRQPLAVSRWAGVVSASLMGTASLCWMIFSFARPSLRLSLPTTEALAFGVIGLALAMIVWKSLHAGSTPRQYAVGTLSAAAFLAYLYVGPVMTVQAKRCEDIAGHVAELKQKLPTNVTLFSFEQTHHAFVFFYGDDIPVRPLPRTAADLSDDVEYFCIHRIGADRVDLPFAWEEVATVVCDRLHKTIPDQRVLVGRRLRPQLSAARSSRSAE